MKIFLEFSVILNTFGWKRYFLTQCVKIHATTLSNKFELNPYLIYWYGNHDILKIRAYQESYSLVWNILLQIQRRSLQKKISESILSNRGFGTTFNWQRWCASLHLSSSTFIPIVNLSRSNQIYQIHITITTWNPFKTQKIVLKRRTGCSQSCCRALWRLI